MELGAIIIEDEPKSRSTLRHLLAKYNPEVNVLAEAPNLEKGIQAIREKNPDLIFLDIELPGESGLELVKYFPEPKFEIVFTTAYNQYAVRAFQMSAVDYLLKPIHADLLQRSVQRAMEKSNARERQEKFQILSENLIGNFQKMVVHTKQGISFVPLDQILFCEAKQNQTVFLLKSKEKIASLKPMRFYEALLEELGFFRINRSFIINLKYLKNYNRTRNGEILLVSGHGFSISDTKREAFLKLVTTG